MRVITDEDYTNKNYNNVVNVKDYNALESLLDSTKNYEVCNLINNKYADVVVKCLDTETELKIDKFELINKAIDALNKIQFAYPDVEITLDTPSGVETCKLINALIYYSKHKDCIVIDAE